MVRKVSHPGTRLISFTGSVPAGKKIAEAAGRAMKNVVCELGGNDAAIVLPDVDAAAVAQKIFGSAFLMSGQTCAAIKRVYVHRSIYDEMADALATLARGMRTGPEADGAHIGPRVTRPQFERVASLVRDALDHGAPVLGRRLGESSALGLTLRLPRCHHVHRLPSRAGITVPQTPGRTST
jgi:acyl-CoA reductase-like NAD-dependent aldehyde dehydrogenase